MQSFHQRRHTDSQLGHEKMLDVTSQVKNLTLIQETRV